MAKGGAPHIDEQQKIDILLRQSGRCKGCQSLLESHLRSEIPSTLIAQGSEGVRLRILTDMPEPIIDESGEEVELLQGDSFNCSTLLAETLISSGWAEEDVAKYCTDLQAQHILPRSLGGTDHPDNVVMLCEDCHGFESKSLRLPTYLLSRLNSWKEENSNSDSFSSIVRIALFNFLDKDGVVPDTEEVHRMGNRIETLQSEIKALKEEGAEMDEKIREQITALAETVGGLDVTPRRYSEYIYPRRTVQTEEKQFVYRRRD